MEITENALLDVGERLSAALWSIHKELSAMNINLKGNVDKGLQEGSDSELVHRNNGNDEGRKIVVDGKEYLDWRECMTMLRKYGVTNSVHVERLWFLCSNEGLPYSMVGGRRLFDPEAIRDWIRKRVKEYVITRKVNGRDYKTKKGVKDADK